MYRNRNISRYRNRETNEVLEPMSLVEMPLDDVSKALEEFGKEFANNERPLVFTPSRGCGLYVSVPHGVAAIGTSWGKFDGVYSEGFHWFPPWKNIPWVVNMQHIPWDYPVKKCPTLDNVYVKIDLLVVFRIVNPELFLVTIGPYKLQDLLVSFIEESIRSLARDVTYDEVYDLRDRQLDAMRRSLNETKLNPVGVEVSLLTVTNVKLPEELAKNMQNETQFDSKQREQRRNQQFQLTLLTDTEELKLKEQQQENDRKEFVEEAKRNLNMISKEVSEVTALTKKRLAEIAAEEESDCARLIFQGELEESKLIGEMERYLATIRATGAKDAAKVNAEQYAYITEKKAVTERTVAERRAKALLLVSNAEASGAKHLAPKRAVNRELEKINIFAALADNKNAIISGSSTDSPTAAIAEYLTPNEQREGRARDAAMALLTPLSEERRVRN